ncbi:hypothetical protein ACQKEF_23650 [Pseudomonas oryzihabitans]|uniref:hypothetical protein n=1 Tax=Pseudomonas oryzihabitans TaxID=47885 RepID=UPI003CFFFB63
MGTQIDKIFAALEAAGYPKKFQRSLLPSWVTREVISNDDASLEIASILAKRLGVKLGPLLSGEHSIEDLKRRDIKYKRSVLNVSKDLSAATSLAMFVAESVAYSTHIPYVPFPSDPFALRAELLSVKEHRWVGLRSLLLLCWNHGVPVIYLDGIDAGIRKMDGMVTLVEDRPVIILSKKSKFWAWQLFVLAHEIGHCARNHIQEGTILVDEDLGEYSGDGEVFDSEEKEADLFALILLNGRTDPGYFVEGNGFNAYGLAQAAIDYGIENRIDPGHIVLNYARENNAWELGVSALKAMEERNAHAGAVVNSLMWRCISEDDLPADTIELLRKVAG